MEANRNKPSLGQRWSDARPTKTVLFWSCVASMVLTMIVGFSWGGWVTGGTARQTAETMARDAVVQRLAPICVVQSGRDLAKGPEARGTERREHVATRRVCRQAGVGDDAG